MVSTRFKVSEMGVAKFCAKFVKQFFYPSLLFLQANRLLLLQYLSSMIEMTHNKFEINISIHDRDMLFQII